MDYAQGKANLSYNKIQAAKQHLSKIKTLVADSNSVSISNLQQCMITSKTVEGEINTKEKNYSTAIDILKKAVAIIKHQLINDKKRIIYCDKNSTAKKEKRLKKKVFIYNSTCSIILYNNEYSICSVCRPR